tara:strand:- start:1193 stop:1447 length:255 start_codon:yes stop_codon:yes gene_type:complete
MKYVKNLKDGSYKYRRRVPDHLQKVFGKSEFSSLLGRTEEEALRAYPDVHEHFERIIKTFPTPPQHPKLRLSKNKSTLGFSRSV